MTKELSRGTVLSGTGGVWRVWSESDAPREVTLRGRLKQDRLKGGSALKLAVGDEVELERDERGGRWAISAILPRRTELARRAPGGARGERVVAANIDEVVVVFAAAEPEPHPRLLDRFLVIAEANDIPARVVVNKEDLADPQALRECFEPYERAGYPLHFTSAKSGAGLASLRDVLHARVSALTGPSGVGKSSLLNAMFPGFGIRVGEISRSVLKGRHTTVSAELHPLPGGGFVMDTPGLREVGLWGLAADALDRCFPEFRPLLGHCRFADCRHHLEPECAVRAAAERSEVSAARYESYLKLYEEVKEAARR